MVLCIQSGSFSYSHRTNYKTPTCTKSSVGGNITPLNPGLQTPVVRLEKLS
jgi:hypothetical protein